MVSAAIDAMGGGVQAYAVDHLRLDWLCEALEAWVSFRCVRLVTAKAAALGVDFWVSSSWVAELPAESALGGGGG